MGIRDNVKMVNEFEVSQSYLYSASVKYLFNQIEKAFDEGRLIEVEVGQGEVVDLMSKIDKAINLLDDIDKLLKENKTTAQKADFSSKGGSGGICYPVHIPSPFYKEGEVEIK